MVKRLLSMVILLWLAAPAWAARVDLSAATRELVLGQTVSLTVDVVDGRPEGVPEILAPPGLAVQFHSQSQQTTSVNFKVSRLVRFQYQLQAREEGSFTLGPARVTVDGVPAQSGELRVEVGPRPETPSAPISADIEFTPSEAWEGQVVVMRYRLRSREEVLESQWSLPELEGLVAPRDGDRPRARYGIQDEQGVLSVDETFVPFVAARAGDWTIHGAMVRVSLPEKSQRRGRDPFDPFGLMRPARSASVLAEAAPLRVRQLPPPPPGFSGLIGDFEFSAEVDRAEVSVGESINWRVRAQGDGVLESWSLPPLQAVEGARIYQSSPSAGAEVREGRYVAAGEITQVIVPTREGTLEIAPMQLVTFSPSQGRYVTHTLAVPPLTVRAGGEAASQVESFGAPAQAPQGSAEQEMAEVRAVGPGLAVRLDPYLGWLALLAGSPGLALLGLSGWARAQAVHAKRRVTNKPSSRLNALPAEPTARAAALEVALREVLAERAGVAPTALDRVAAIESLEPNVRELAQRAARALDRALFAGVALAAEDEDAAIAAVRALEAR